MSALTRIRIALVASALMLAGCVSSGPGLYIDSSAANGKSPAVFSQQEIPTIRYSLPETQVSGVAIKVLMQPAGITVWRQYARVSDFDDFPDNGLEIDHPTHFEPEEKMEFPGLVSGNYTAELWIKGRKESSLNFSVSNSASHGSFQRRPHMPGSGEIYVPPATARFHASRNSMNPAVAQLDTFVGLTDEQKAEVTKIYLDENPPAIASSGDQMEKLRMKIYLLLSPEQQKLYDDDGSAVRGVEQLLGRLNESVELTPEQNAEVAKIMAGENLMPKAFSSLKARSEEKVVNDQSARAKVLALLTPVQRKIYDDAPQRPVAGMMKGSIPLRAVAFRERVTYIGDLIKKSLAMTARLGLITEVKPVWDPSSTFENGFKSVGHPDSASGQFRYDVEGSERSEQLTVYWKKVSPTAPIEIVKIEGRAGEVIAEKL
ncbi:MAG TPA: hypothetical protein VGM64_03475 [Lacunisphaera sp.]|jgi:hypothetical protein